MKGRHERIKKGWSGSAAVWLLLVPLFVLIVLKTDFLPQVARLGDTSFTKVADEMVQKVSSLGLDRARWQQQQTLDVAKLEDSNQPNQQILAMSRSKDSRLINSGMQLICIFQITNSIVITYDLITTVIDL
ncbi:Os06g0311000 [Oryza sativa Japonica Group]|uniref:Os06g0311000 protein n=1 Tax=Oryza sativa subsp. japonica TaxID=39947 RepID=Q0DCM7_ORYSJ|nr:Os06g0311000 [Oryza sativa Japonica Group]|eukprot:NP_001057482.2 Os06g0311000 [Oryza sativa Japonica Group]